MVVNTPAVTPKVSFFVLHTYETIATDESCLSFASVFFELISLSDEEQSERERMAIVGQ